MRRTRQDPVNLDTGRHHRNPSVTAARSIYLSSDGVHQHRTDVLSNPRKKPRIHATEHDPFSQWHPMPSDSTRPDAEAAGSEQAAEEQPGEKRKQYASSTNPMAQWRPLKALFLDEILRHDGLGNDFRHPTCAYCRQPLQTESPGGPRFFRCDDCGQHLQCISCCLAAHERFPLHPLKEWNGNFWTPQTLVQLGLVYQLGHGGFPCPFPDPALHKMTVIDIPFLHTVHFRYCNCARAQEADNVSQLLRNAWYPATVIDPATCATFRTLESFRLFNVVGNLNVSDFISALERMTSSMAVTGLVSVPDRTRQFQRISRQWAFLSRAKRSARGHDPDGLDATALGACAVACWACPHEGRNLPLGPGWGFWVEPVGYAEHVKKYVSETDMSTCIAFAALLQKDTRMTTGLRVSGVGGCVCARHECMRPNGLGDLQKGERYCNIDWILFSSIMAIALLFLMISYDIACQWKLHLPERIPRLPPHMQKDLDETKVKFGLPVWHANSHTGDCKENNKLSYKRGAGKTDGEAIERVWSGLNPAALATKEMGLGNQADTIDDRIDNHNFLKNMTLGITLQRRLLLARDERQRQVDAFQAVNDGINVEVQRDWKRHVREWEEDESRPNPYILPTKGLPTEAEIRLQLQQEERQQSVDGRAFIAGGSATAFLSAGIQIEDTQYRIKELLKEQVLLTADRENKLDEQRAALLRKIARFRELQAVYIPGAAGVLAAAEFERDSNAPPPFPEDIVLFMPSQMPRRPDSVILGCLPGLLDIEERLRRWLIAYRNANMTGQHQTTKAAKLVERVSRRGDGQVARYRRAYTALGGLGVWLKYPQLRELKSDDVRLPGDDDDADLDARKKLAMIGARRGVRPPRNMPSNSRQVMSWIWTAPGAFDDDEEQLHDSMRVEWARAFARKNRWNEEVMLLEEEMRRVLRYLAWEAGWWRAQAGRREELDAALAGGLRSYALKRASQSEQVMMHFRLKWATSESRTLTELETLATLPGLIALPTDLRYIRVPLYFKVVEN
ncbi:hypothetical protein C8F01DRAFT_1252352 [Mycena amicta]|nr:hypothetical protein C8F01DRAFT_1252352 [Mycena amicta]